MKIKETPEVLAMFAAHKALQAAIATLKATTKAAFPVGDDVQFVYTRNGKQYSILAEVQTYCYEPGYIIIKNIETGKCRKVNAPWSAERGELA